MFSNIIDYLVFCEETSAIYPFAIPYAETTLGNIHKIECITDGNNDTEAIHAACIVVLGESEV